MNKTLNIALVAGAVLSAVPSYGCYSRLLKYLVNMKTSLNLSYNSFKKIRTDYAEQQDAKLTLKVAQANNKIIFYNNPYSIKAHLNDIEIKNKNQYGNNPILWHKEKNTFIATIPRAFIASVTDAINAIRGQK